MTREHIHDAGLKLAHSDPLDLGDCPPRPLVIVVGVPRSGTTLTMQRMAEAGLTVATNIGARMWWSPAYGHVVSESVRASCDDPPRDFRSEVGRTRHPLDVHELGHFWDRVAPPQDEAHERDSFGLGLCRWSALRMKLRRWSAVADAPVAMKGVSVMLNAARLARELPEALFVHVVRNPVDVALSAAERHAAVDPHWFSLRLAHCAHPALTVPAHRAAWVTVEGQRRLVAQLEQVESERVFRVAYEDVAANPNAAFDALLSTLGVAAPRMRRLATRTHSEHPHRAAMVARLAALEDTWT